MGAIVFPKLFGVPTRTVGAMAAPTTGAIPYASSTTAFSFLAAGTNGHVLTLAAGVPTWAATQTPDLSGYGALAGTQSWTGVNTFRGNQASGLVIGNGGVIDFSASTGPYFKGNATVGFRLNNAADSLNLWVVEDNGDVKIYSGTSGIKFRIRETTGAFATGTTNPAAQAHIVNIGATNVSAMIVAGVSGQSAVLQQLQGISSVQMREQVDLDTAWATSTDASRKARFLLRVWDTAAREVMRGEASGTAAMIGFLGANAVVRQTLSAAATDAATNLTLTNEIRTALINLGLAA